MYFWAKNEALVLPEESNKLPTAQFRTSVMKQPPGSEICGAVCLDTAQRGFGRSADLSRFYQLAENEGGLSIFDFEHELRNQGYRYVGYGNEGSASALPNIQGKIDDGYAVALRIAGGNEARIGHFVLIRSIEQRPRGTWLISVYDSATGQIPVLTTEQLFRGGSWGNVTGGRPEYVYFKP